MSKLKQSLLSIILGLVLAAGISYAYSPPLNNPPNNGSITTPINTGTSSQTKIGSLDISITGQLQALGEAVFRGNVTVGTAGTVEQNRNLTVSGALNVNNVFKASGADGLAAQNLNTTGQIETRGFLKIPTNRGSNKVLTSDASGNASWKALCVPVHGSRTFRYTGGTQTFTVPSCVRQVTVTLVGGGGGGASGGGGYGNSDNWWWGPGGGSAVPITKSMKVVPGESINVIVGAGNGGGAAIDGTRAGESGLDGEDSSFMALTSSGGGGGQYTGTGGVSGGRNGCNDRKTVPGEYCENNTLGDGGGNLYGAGGDGNHGYFGRAGSGGNGYGSGGGGGGLGSCNSWLFGNCNSDENSGAGGAGANGLVLVRW